VEELIELQLEKPEMEYSKNAYFLLDALTGLAPKNTALLANIRQNISDIYQAYKTTVNQLPVKHEADKVHYISNNFYIRHDVDSTDSDSMGSDGVYPPKREKHNKQDMDSAMVHDHVPKEKIHYNASQAQVFDIDDEEENFVHGFDENDSDNNSDENSDVDGNDIGKPKTTEKLPIDKEQHLPGYISE
jgi:hypothetical protein